MKALLSLLLTLVGTQAHAFIVLKNFNGETEHWGSSSVTWTMSTSVMNDVPVADLTSALTNAFKAWQDVACATITFTYGGQKATDPQTGIHFTFRQNGWDPAVADALAYSVSETQSDGRITSTDIVFNAFDAEWSAAGSTPFGKQDIQGVATHEIGHSLGLDHSRVFDATMFFSGGSTGLRTLDPDDTRGLCFLYPTTAFTSGQLCDACETTSNCSGGTCLSWGGGHSYCGRNCSAQNACPAGFTCYEIQDVATPQCIPDSEFCHDHGGNVALGEPCFGNAQCASGQCLVLSHEAYCSKDCNASNPGSCGAGYTCVDPGVCLKAGQTPYGGRCEEMTDCATAQCVYFQFSVGVCSEACSNDSDCPNGDRCYEDAACVPPGPLGNGAACAAPDQCKGMYCEQAKCTQTCDGGCPRGTTCQSGFCAGSEVGASCSVSGACPEGLTCQTASADDAGTCQRQCSAFTGSGCEAGEVCEWYWQAYTQKILGRCVAENGGQKLGESCAEQYCEADLVCRYEAAKGGPICHRDCRLSDGYGCDALEECVSLDDAADPQHGLCIGPMVTQPDPGPEPAPEPVADTAVDEDTGAATETGTGVGEDATAGTDTGASAGEDVVIVPRKTGSGAGCGVGGDASWLLVGLVVFRRRR